MQTVKRRVSSCLSIFLQGFADMMEHEAMMVVVMEFCDLWSLQRAISKKAFKPHGKFTDQATYVSQTKLLGNLPLKNCHPLME